MPNNPRAAENLIPFPKGVSGNPSGKPKGTLNSKTILKRFLSLEEEVTNPVTGKKEKMSQLEIMYLKQIAKSRQGDLQSFKEVIDRFEGKAAQSLDVTTAGEQIGGNKLAPEVVDKFTQYLKDEK